MVCTLTPDPPQIHTPGRLRGVHSPRRCGYTHVVDAVFSAISDALARDERVAIAGFGTFSTKTRGARQGRNPGTGESIAIAASKSPAFKAGKTLRDAVRG